MAERRKEEEEGQRGGERAEIHCLIVVVIVKKIWKIDELMTHGQMSSPKSTSDGKFLKDYFKSKFICIVKKAIVMMIITKLMLG